MSSVVETNAQLSSQIAKTKSGQGGQSSGGKGFSGLVDSNLDAATETEAPATSAKPRKGNRTAAADQEPVRTGFQKKTRSTNPVEKPAPTDKPAKANDAQPAETTSEATLAVEAVVKTGIVGASLDLDLTEAVPEPTTEQTPPPAAPVPPVVTGVVAVAVDPAVTASTATVESSDTVPVSNPPATIAPPAGIAANALAKVAADTGDAKVKTNTPVNADTETEADAQTLLATADTAPDAATVETKAEPLVESATPEVQVEAKAKAELATAAKSAETPKPVAPLDHAKLEAAVKIEPASVKDQPKPEQTAKPVAHDDHRVEQKPAPQASSDKPADADVRPAPPRPEQPLQVSTHAQADKPQPNGFGLTQAALHVPNVALQSAAFTAIAATAGTPVPISGLAVEIAANVQIGRSRFEIRLDPPELGRIDVRLDVDKQGQVTSHLIVEKSATLDLLRRDAQQLERALQDAGLKTSDNGLQFSLRDQQQSGRQGDEGSQRNAHRLIVSEEETVAAESAGRSYGRMIGQRGGVDIRV